MKRIAPKFGILLLAYGSPEQLKDLGSFLSNIRGGKEFPKEVVLKFQRRYEQAGGPSPLNPITRMQAESLEKAFQSQGKNYSFTIGMAYCEPFIKKGIQELLEREISHLIGLPMAPHYSHLSTEKYRKFFHQALKELNCSMNTSFIEYWYDEEEVLQFYSEEIDQKLKKLGEGTQLVFTAHSLPSRILKEKDQYPEQIKDHANKIFDRLKNPPKTWHLAYQSQGLGKEPWLGPSLEKVIEDLHKREVKKILLCPIGFACDHIEILYDLDIQAKNQAKSLGIKLTRTPSLNSDPRFIKALQNKISRHIEKDIGK